MNKVVKTYSLVLVGNNHNPTVLTDYFLKKSGIVEDPDKEINKDSIIITPAVSQVNIKSGTSIIVESNRLLIQSQNSQDPYIIAERYCKNLQYIQATGVGINFDIEADDFDFDKWFANKLHSNAKGLVIKAVEYAYSVVEGMCNIKVTKLSENKAHFRFNYHQDLQSVPLGELKIDFLKKSEEYLRSSFDLVDQILEQ